MMVPDHWIETYAARHIGTHECTKEPCQDHELEPLIKESILGFWIMRLDTSVKSVAL